MIACIINTVVAIQYKCRLFAISDRSFEEIFKSLVTCSVCYEVYNEPKILPCHHTYCKKCLERLFQSSEEQIMCPQCREDIPRYMNEDSFPPAFVINNLMELYRRLKVPEEMKRLEELERVRLIQVQRDKEVEEKMAIKEKRWVKANRDALKSENPNWRVKDDEDENCNVDTDWEGEKLYHGSHGSDSANWRAHGRDEGERSPSIPYKERGWRQHTGQREKYAAVTMATGSGWQR